jgi:hypothetical protein
MGTRKTTSQLKDTTSIRGGVSESSGKTAALYLRRSAVHERGDNTSIDYQRDACERIAAQHGLEVVTEFNEGQGRSASSLLLPLPAYCNGGATKTVLPTVRPSLSWTTSPPRSMRSMSNSMTWLSGRRSIRNSTTGRPEHPDEGLDRSGPLHR